MADDPEFDVEGWRAELEEKRDEKDEFLSTHPQSPIPPEEREGFDGLAYFEPDPQYRLETTVSIPEDPASDPVYMETTAGGEARYLRTVVLTMDIEREDPDLADTELELAGYEREGSDGALFVPFRDKTTGQMTYAGGRYMELAAEDDLAEGDSIVVDFNLAYTPFCAYSETFECPLPPEENWLEVAIPAGERLE